MNYKSLYIINLSILFFLFIIVNLSETFLIDYSTIRREVFLNSNQTKNMKVSSFFWDNQLDKSEIIINGNYYDIKEVKVYKNKILLKVVHDKYDLAFKKISQNLKKKHKLLKAKKGLEIIPVKEFKGNFIETISFLLNNFKTQSMLLFTIVIRPIKPPQF